MQTFLPSPDFDKCADILDNGRLNNQVNECLVILRLVFSSTMPKKVIKRHWKPIDIRCPNWLSVDVLNIGEWVEEHTKESSSAWRNHPATRMWREKRWALLSYSYAMIRGLERRGFETSRHRANLKPFGLEQTQAELAYNDLVVNDLADFDSSYSRRNSMPWWLGFGPIHSSHRGALLSKNYDYYKRFGWAEEPVQEYHWPE